MLRLFLTSLFVPFSLFQINAQWILSQPIADDIQDLFFLSPTEGWAIGESARIINTTDGGNTWNFQQEGGSCTSMHGGEIFFSSSQKGYIVGPCDESWYTIDAGTTWTRINGGNFGGNSVFFTSENVGWSVDGSSIYHTSDGGNSWTLQKQVGKQLYSIFFVSPTKGWTVGFNNTIYITTDGGINWIQQFPPSLYDSLLGYTAYSLNSVYFISELKGWAVGDYGVILSTSSGGATWTMQRGNVLNYKSYNSVHFVSETKGWVVGDEGKIFATDDGGNTWVSQESGVINNLNDIQFVSDNDGWIAGDGGIILKTNNGGKISTSINNIQNQRASIFPIPATDYIYSSIERNGGSSKIYLYDIAGKPVKELLIVTNTNYYVGDLPSGIYIYEIINEKETPIKKGSIIIE